MRVRLSQSLPNEDPRWDFGEPPERQQNGARSVTMNYSDEFESTTAGMMVEVSKVPQMKQRRMRPRSYAEPGGSRLSFSYCGSGTCDNGILVRNGFHDDLVTFGEDSEGTYNGIAISDLEARVSRLRRRQQMEKRKSISNFAISCLEPNPTAYFVQEEQVVI